MKKIDRLNAVYYNACKFEVNIHRITGFDPIDELIRISGMCFREIGDEDAESLVALRKSIWKIRSTVVFSLVPFDDNQLLLSDQISSLVNDTKYVPFLKDKVAEIERIIEYLILNPNNPKREAVTKILSDSCYDNKKIGLITNIVRGTIPGWDEKSLLSLKDYNQNLELISSKKILINSIYKKLILSAGGNLCPYLSSLYYSFRSKYLDIIVYNKEYVRYPEKKELPLSDFILTKSREDAESVIDTKNQVNESLTEEELLAQKSFWDHMRKSIFEKSSESDYSKITYEFLVDSRLVLLENNTKIYLRNDMYIIEISDYIDGAIGIDEKVKKFPRKMVKNLDDGDLIVLRTTGSGDYLYEVANSLMRNDLRFGLYEKSTEWKEQLKKALEDKGSLYFFDKLKLKGHNISNHQYIWNWTTEYVIRPQSKQLFIDLIIILNLEGYISTEKDIEIYANEKWAQMKDIIRYHIMAGHKIRVELLAKLRRLIKKGISIKEQYNLTLSENGAGEMSVFRVAAVDTEIVKIPFSSVGVIMEV